MGEYECQNGDPGESRTSDALDCSKKNCVTCLQGRHRSALLATSPPSRCGWCRAPAPDTEPATACQVPSHAPSTFQRPVRPARGRQARSALTTAARAAARTPTPARGLPLAPVGPLPTAFYYVEPRLLLTFRIHGRNARYRL